MRCSRRNHLPKPLIDQRGLDSTALASCRKEHFEQSRKEGG